MQRALPVLGWNPALRSRTADHRLLPRARLGQQMTQISPPNPLSQEIKSELGKGERKAYFKLNFPAARGQVS